MRLAVLCPGQGVQHSAMFAPLFRENAALPVFAQAQALLGLDISTQLASLPNARLFENAFAQPLLCTAALATWQCLRAHVPAPVLFAGYSIGELAAYGCAGALAVEDLLRLAQRRAALMDAAGAGATGLLAVRGFNRAQIDQLCRQYHVEIAIINSPNHFILGGALAALAAVEQAAAAQGARQVQRLPVAVAAHTSVLRPAGEAFVEALNASELSHPAVPVLAGVDGTAVRQRAAAITALSGQLYRPLRWLECMHSAVEMGAQVFLELGPGTSLTRMLLETYPNASARSVAEFRSLEGVIQWLEKQDK